MSIDPPIKETGGFKEQDRILREPPRLETLSSAASPETVENDGRPDPPEEADVPPQDLQDNPPHHFQPIDPLVDDQVVLHHPVTIVCPPNALPPRPAALNDPAVVLLENPHPPPPAPHCPPMNKNNRSLHSILDGLGDGSIASIQEVGMQIVHEHQDMIASDNTIEFAITPSIFRITPPRLST
jgi:hypothetical protein